MTNYSSLLEIIRVDRVIGTRQLQTLVAPLRKPFTAVCLRLINTHESAKALETAMLELTGTRTACCFFGPYFMKGCVRDDFDFGPVLVFQTNALLHYMQGLPECRYAAFYALWLGVKLHDGIRAIQLPAGQKIYEIKTPKSVAESHFDYVDPRYKDIQYEMEHIFTSYLGAEQARLTDTPAPTTFTEAGFPVEATVVIPVKNRARTIVYALESALSQQTAKPFNVIVVDNHSTDGTTEKIQTIAEKDERLVHIVPKANDLQIGGCWNLAANDPRCGRFCIQLDSDDVYNSPQTIQTILDTFYREECGMVVGSYTLTDFDMKPIPPGLIDHREWTDKNGRNNLLRVNGIGAPRAFYTPLLRKHPAPNVSYGEDYALALTFSRLYRIGRVYESLYFCRRWEDNTDANPDPELKVKQNRYKDELRTNELEIRMHKLL